MRRFGIRTIGKHRQDGATAIEFALVLPIMFVLFYGALTYGLIFLMRMSLQHAAEDGARAALRYPEQSCAEFRGRACGADEQKQYQYVARLNAAHIMAATQARWMNLREGVNPVSVASRICRTGIDCVADAGSPVVTCNAADCDPSGPLPDCGEDLGSSCQIVVTVVYDYATVPFVPRALGFGLVTPDRLTGQARLLLDGRTLAS